jgi:hypothetical protein
MMDSRDLKKHRDNLEKAIDKLPEIYDALFKMAKEKRMRLDFVRTWILAPRSKREKPMPPISLYGASIGAGKISAKRELERELQNTIRNLERL